jgi:hypothetical protein
MSTVDIAATITIAVNLVIVVLVLKYGNKKK